MKRVLIVAYYFPPIATSGSLRPSGFCRYLEQYDWLPRVLAAEPGSVHPPQAVDENLCIRLPDRLQIDRVPDANPMPALIRTRSILRRKIQSLLPREWTQLPTGDNQSRHEEAKPRGRFPALKDFIADRLFAFPDQQRFWLRPAVRRLSQLPRSRRPDAVFATGAPWTNLLVGKALAQRFGVPLVVDFRDPWTGNLNQQSLSAALLHKAKALERSVCTAADRVIANTEELRAKFLVDYPEFEDKFITITNGFDSEVYNLTVNSCAAREHLLPSARSMLELCHFGTIYSNRDPMALLRAIQELFEEHRIEPGQLRVRFVGIWERRDDRCEGLARELERAGFVQREPPVSHQACLQQMAAAQMLFILQPEFPLQIPAKIYEYMATGRPLLIIGGEGATASLVERHRLGKCCPNRVAEIKALLWRLVNGQERIDPPRSADMTRFDYRTLAGELACVLDAVCTEKATTHSPTGKLE